MTQHIVPMLESERGWGNKIDGYAGPFHSLQAAKNFQREYNRVNNNADRAPDWYIVALDPKPHCGERCEYRTYVPVPPRPMIEGDI